MNKYNIIDSLENLEKRLIDDYNGISEFEQQGQDRLDVRHAINYIKSKEREAENIPLAALKLLGLKPQQFVKIKNIFFGNDIIFKVTDEAKKQYFYLKSYECEFTEKDFVKLIRGGFELEFDDKKTFCRAYMDAKAEALGLLE